MTTPLPEIDPKTTEWPTEILRTMMAVAIPTGDIGSRGAIQYAPEIIEALAVYGVRLVPTDSYSSANVHLAIEEMRQMDKPTVT